MYVENRNRIDTWQKKQQWEKMLKMATGINRVMKSKQQVTFKYVSKVNTVLDDLNSQLFK